MKLTEESGHHKVGIEIQSGVKGRAKGEKNYVESCLKG